MKENYNLKTSVYDLLLCIIGSFILGASLSIFTIPNEIAPGGVSGLATALAYVTPIHVSVWNLIFNIPLLIFAWRLMGLRRLIYTVLCTVFLSVSIEICDYFIPGYTNDKLLAAFFGGVGSGLGVGLLFLRGISTGGTDLLALILKRYLPNISSGRLLLFADATVVVIAMLIFRDIDVALYSSITIFVSSKVIDGLIEGSDKAKVIYIVTKDGPAIAKAITAYTDRSSTIIPAIGGYTGNERQVVMLVTRRNALSESLRLIKRVDPDSFVFVVDSTEVHGEGFGNHNADLSDAEDL